MTLLFTELSGSGLFPSLALLCWSVLAVLVYRRFFGPKRMRIVTVIDGDTVVAITMSGQKLKLRLKGVDCPELGQRMSFEAKQFIKDNFEGKWVSVTLRGVDRYQRPIASIRFGSLNLERELIAEGLGFPLPGSGYKLLALRARLSRRGIWSQGGQPQPWESPSRGRGLLWLLNKSKAWRKYRRTALEKSYQARKF